MAARADRRIEEPGRGRDESVAKVEPPSSGAGTASTNADFQHTPELKARQDDPRSGPRRLLRPAAVPFFEVEAVEEAVENGREDDAGDPEDREPAIERVEA